MAISRILSPEFLRGDDHLSRPDFSERPMLFSWRRRPLQPSWCDDTRRSTPKFFGACRTGCPPPVLSCTAWGFSCRANYSARG